MELKLNTYELSTLAWAVRHQIKNMEALPMFAAELNNLKEIDRQITSEIHQRFLKRKEKMKGNNNE